jgi:hypothetical protein
MFVYTEPRSAKLQPRSVSPSRFHVNDWSTRLQISYPKDSNGHLYLFSFQSLVVPSSPSGSNGTLRIPFIFLSLWTTFFATGGTPPPPIFLDHHSVRSLRFPAIHPISLQSLTKCSSRNSFVLITIHFHGGCTPLYPERFVRRVHLARPEPSREQVAEGLPRSGKEN